MADDRMTPAEFAARRQLERAEEMAERASGTIESLVAERHALFARLVKAEAERDAAVAALNVRRGQLGGKTILDLQGRLNALVTDAYIALRERTGVDLFTDEKADELVNAVEDLCLLAHAIGEHEARLARDALDAQCAGLRMALINVRDSRSTHDPETWPINIADAALRAAPDAGTRIARVVEAAKAMGSEASANLKQALAALASAAPEAAK